MPFHSVWCYHARKKFNVNQVTEFFEDLFDSSDWPPRWHCGRWTEFHGWLYIISDLLIWAAYFSIPLVILKYVLKKRDIRFVRLYFLFAAFILACGATHFLDAAAFWIPMYRLNALFRFITALVSWITVYYLIKHLPLLASLKSQGQLEVEVRERKKAEEKFKGLLEAAPDAMVITDEKGVIVLVNRQTELLSGYEKEELIGEAVEMLLPGCLNHGLMGGGTEYVHHPILKTIAARLELFAIKKNQVPVPVEISLAFLTTDDGQLIFASIRNVSERKKAEKAKKDFQLLVSSVKDYAIFLLDKSGHVISWNSGAQHIKGYSEEILGQSMNVFYTAEEIQKGEPERNLRLAMELGHYETEGWRLRKDGSRFFANIVITALLDEQGELYGYAKVTKDITEKRNAEERLRFVASIADNIQDPIIVYDSEFRVTSWNDAAEKMFEWKENEVIGRRTNDFLRVDYISESREEILIALAQKAFWHGELVYHTKSGRPVNALATASNLMDATGEVNGHLVLVRDISQRKQAENRLSQMNAELEERVLERTEQIGKSEKKYRYLFENNPMPLFIVDRYTFRYLAVNEAALRQYGYGRDEFLSMVSLDALPDAAEVLHKARSNAYPPFGETHDNGIWRHLKKDGSVILVEMIAHEMMFEGIEANLVLASDVTEAQKARHIIQNMNLELEGRVARRTEELEVSRREMEAFTYSVSHDLRAPLRGVIGFTTILEEDYASQLDDEAKRIARIIKGNAIKMGQLIDDLLAFSHAGKRDIVKGTVDTAAMVKEIVCELDSNDAAKLLFNLTCLPQMNADSKMIRQVWVNLIANAIKYSAKEKVSKIEIGSHLKDGSNVYYVRDNGVGFDEQYKDKLFKVFQRLHGADDFEGTGVGLALVHTIISKHGGRVWAEGKEGEGACFSFTVPG